jgi:hypothetical protein
MPWRVAFALQADGWYLRQDIIWSKPNPMPESVRDRCTKAHEYIFLLSKSERYYYDANAIAEPASWQSKMPDGWDTGAGAHGTIHRNGREAGTNIGASGTARNKRSVWEVATAPFSEAHFATFPPALIEPCILAGCPERCCAECGAPWVRKTSFEYVKYRPSGGRTSRVERGNKVHDGGYGNWGTFGTHLRKKVETIGFSPSCSCDADTVAGTVLDPFGGAGTTGLVADRFGRNAILIELNEEYARIARQRVEDDAGMFAQVI